VGKFFLKTNKIKTFYSASGPRVPTPRISGMER